MPPRRIVRASSLLVFPLALGCVGTTGSGIVDFDAYASGPPDATGTPGSEHAYAFASPYTGYAITLRTATLQIGAVYLDATPCTGSSDVPACVDQDAETIAQVNGGVQGAFGVETSGVLLDALSPDPQAFATGGTGIVQPARSAEVWLVAPDGMADPIDDPANDAVIATASGTAEKDGHAYPFTASVSIGANRMLPAENPALPGENPICLQRIVRPICLSPALEPEPGTALRVGVDPKGWFDNVDFSRLGPSGGVIPDSNDDVNGHNLFQGLESSSGVYTFSFAAP